MEQLKIENEILTEENKELERNLEHVSNVLADYDDEFKQLNAEIEKLKDENVKLTKVREGS
jgi:predicted  nucleic acid-binding Zn-ribbon protein